MRRHDYRIRNKIADQKTAKQPHRQILTVSLLSFFVLSTCLCGLSWAWFTSSQSVSAGSITSASYTIEATVNDGSVLIDKPENSQSMTINGFTAGTPYRVTLTASGNASNGYCLVTVGRITYIKALAPGESVELSYTPDSAASMDICWSWGTYSGETSYEELPESIGTAQSAVIQESLPSENVEASAVSDETTVSNESTDPQTSESVSEESPAEQGIETSTEE